MAQVAPHLPFHEVGQRPPAIEARERIRDGQCVKLLVRGAHPGRSLARALLELARMGTQLPQQCSEPERRDGQEKEERLYLHDVS